MGMTLDTVREQFGTQSLRSGGATLVAAEGISYRLFQRHGGWRSVINKNMYVSDSLEARLSVTKAILLPAEDAASSHVEMLDSSDQPSQHL